MILTCPACSTRYFANDGAIGAKGRTVRCASCAHSWHAKADDFSDDGASMTLSTPADAPETPQAAPQPKAKEEPAKPVTPHATFRAKQAERTRRKKLVVISSVWGGVAFSLILGLVLSFVFREGIVRIWPKSASAYAAIGATVNPYGLEFEGVKMERQVVDGSPVLAVNGALRNASERDQTALPIELMLLDHKGRETYSWTVKPEVKTLKPGQVAKFLTRIADPPAESMQLAMTLKDQAPMTKSEPDKENDKAKEEVKSKKTEAKPKRPELRRSSDSDDVDNADDTATAEAEIDAKPDGAGDEDGHG